MHIDAPCLTVMDLTVNHCGIGICFHLEASYSVPVDVAALKVTLEGMEKLNYSTSRELRIRNTKQFLFMTNDVIRDLSHGYGLMNSPCRDQT